MQTGREFYNDISGAYDLLIKWDQRLERERPFFEKSFRENSVKAVLDTAAGTGMHAAAFHDWGFKVTAADISDRMLETAAKNADKRDIRFVRAGFSESDGIGEFDAVTCLGNSLPHVLTDDELEASLASMYGALKPGGILVIHNNNYDRILSTKERFMPLSSAAAGQDEYLFVRFFDFHEEYLTFNIITLAKIRGEWSRHVSSTKHNPMTRGYLVEKLKECGFTNISEYGGFPDVPFDKSESDNLIIIAKK